jgi:hypothetical protein
MSKPGDNHATQFCAVRLPKFSVQRFADNRLFGVLLIAAFGFMSISGCKDKVEESEKPVSKLSPEELEHQEHQEEHKLDYFATLLQLESRFVQVSFAQRVQDSKMGVELADKLLEFELTPAERSRALVSLFGSLNKLHATRHLQSSERLGEMAEEYCEDSNASVAKAARVAKVAVHLVDFIRTDFGAYEPLRDDVKELLATYPDDLEIAANLETVTIRLFQRGKNRESNEIMALMMDAYSASKDERMQQYSGILNDRIKLVELNFRGLVQNLEMGGEDDHKAFVATLKKLVADKDIGFTAFEEISRAGRWLEQVQRYKTAGQIYQLMATSLTNHQTKELADAAKLDSELGLRRIKQLGTKLELRGETVFGDEIDPKEFEDKVVLLMFWASDKPVSLRAMGELFEVYSTFSRDQFEIIAIATDTDARKPIEVLGTQVPPWTILLPNVGKKPDEKTLIDECAVNYVPYTLLIDPSGRVNQINLSRKKLEDRIKRLLMDFGKTPVINEPANRPKVVSPVEQTG